MHRKKPFSHKQKKVQLSQKRAKKRKDLLEGEEEEDEIFKEIASTSHHSTERAKVTPDVDLVIVNDKGISDKQQVFFLNSIALMLQV